MHFSRVHLVRKQLLLGTNAFIGFSIFYRQLTVHLRKYTATQKIAAVKNNKVKCLLFREMIKTSEILFSIEGKGVYQKRVQALATAVTRCFFESC
jgi:extradiol dioxygenase family protein